MSLFAACAYQTETVFPGSFHVTDGTLRAGIEAAMLSLPPLGPVVRNVLLSFSECYSLVSSVVWSVHFSVADCLSIVLVVRRRRRLADLRSLMIKR